MAHIIGNLVFYYNRIAFFQMSSVFKLTLLLEHTRRAICFHASKEKSNPTKNNLFLLLAAQNPKHLVKA